MIRSMFIVGALCVYILWVVTLVICFIDDQQQQQQHDGGGAGDNNDGGGNDRSVVLPYPLALFAWSMGQWTILLLPQLSQILTKKAWVSFEQRKTSNNNLQYRSLSGGTNDTTATSTVLDIQVLNVQQFKDPKKALEFLTTQYGKDWRERPVLFQNLWTTDELSSPSRRLSVSGMLNMNWTIPYYTDARVYGALQPDDELPISDIVTKIQSKQPYKIGSQFVVQHDPTLMKEVAPNEYITTLFGNYFSTDQLLGHGKTLGIFPGLTTVPVFVANTAISPKFSSTTTVSNSKECEVGTDDGADTSETCTLSGQSTETNEENNVEQNNDDIDDAPKPLSEDSDSDHPVTGLHCEPIANVAVQLAGSRKWTLIDPAHSWLLRPAISSDGRSFYPSWISTEDLKHVPRYEVMTGPGDAVFVPTWTWHRVDYTSSTANDHSSSTTTATKQQNSNEQGNHGDISIGASLFHFRIGDYIRRNPLFAVLLIPAIAFEAMGVSSQ